MKLSFLLFLVLIFVVLPVLALQYLVMPQLLSQRTADIRAEALANDIANGNKAVLH